MKRNLGLVALALAALSVGTVVRAEEEGGEGRGRGGSAGGGGSEPSGGGGGGGSAKKGNAAAGAAIYGSSCAVCHGADGGGASGPRVRGAGAGEVYAALREGEGGMPTFRNLSRKDARNIAAYLRNPGSATPAPSPTPAPTPSPAPSPAPSPNPAPTWKSDIQGIFQQNCGLCHSGAAAALKIRLDTYATASTNASRALSAIDAGRMPPGGRLPAAQVQAIRDWIAAGKPQ